MFFVASKVLGAILEPITLLVLLGFVGVALSLAGRPRWGNRLAIGAALVFACVCFSPLSNALMRPLEDRFPQPPADMPAPAGIIVLGGALDESLGAPRGQTSLNEAAPRLTTGVALALRYPRSAAGLHRG